MRQYLLEKQTPEGFWTQYPGGGLDLSATVKAYFALKLTGHDPASEPMQRARAVIMAGGGADAVNSFTRFYLALLGQIPTKPARTCRRNSCCLPNWFPVNLYSISAWSRTILVPLSIMSAFQPVRHIEPERGIRELLLSDPLTWPYPRCPGLPRSKRIVSWDRFFHGIDKVFKFLQRHRSLPLRRWAVEAAERWMLQRFAGSDGLGAIFPPMIWSIVALRRWATATIAGNALLPQAALEPGDRRGTHRPLAAVQIAGVGYGAHVAGLGRKRPGGRPSRRRARRAVAVGAGNSHARRLVAQR